MSKSIESLMPARKSTIGGNYHNLLEGVKDD